MHPIRAVVEYNDHFLRRRDLLRLGFTDADVRRALRDGELFRVRHGWYSTPSAPDVAIRAVRVGGRLTGLSALSSYGISVPYPTSLEVIVPRGACRLRDPDDRSLRLLPRSVVSVRWAGRRWTPRISSLGSWRSGRHPRSPSIWRVSPAEALMFVIARSSRDVAVAACDQAVRAGLVAPAELNRIFERSSKRTRRWCALVDPRSESHGESFLRLWLADAGLKMEPQVHLAGVGRLDGRVGPRVFIEVDGSGHRPDVSLEQYETDHRRDALVAVGGGRTLRFTYRQLYGEPRLCVAAVARAVADEGAAEMKFRGRRARRFRKI